MADPVIYGMERRGRIVRCVWAACLLLAGFNHASILLQHGLFWDYYGARSASAFYWSSLTFIDPLVAILLIIRPRVGVPATVVVIATNVIHNLLVTADHARDAAFTELLTSSWEMMSQIGFLLIVVATWWIAWKDIRRGGTVRPGRPS
jgi:hypothetical protein